LPSLKLLGDRQLQLLLYYEVHKNFPPNRKYIEEAVGNAKKYARASKIEISLTVGEEALLVEVRDDGIGFDVDKILSSIDQGGGLILNMMKRAELKIESTLSSLGTIYPQLLTSQSTNYVADYSRLSEEVDEEVRTLQDHLEALEEVKLGLREG